MELQVNPKLKLASDWMGVKVMENLFWREEKAREVVDFAESVMKYPRNLMPSAVVGRHARW